MNGKSDPGKEESSVCLANVSEVELRAAQVAQLYSQVRVGMFASVLAALALAALLWDAAPRERILVWVMVFLAVQIPRHILLQRFSRVEPQGAGAVPWGKWFLLGSGTTALLFGSSAVVIFPSDDFVHQCVLAVFLGGFAASTAVAHAPLKECYVSSVLLTLLPLLGRFLYQGGESGLLLAAVGLMFATALLGTGHSLHRMIVTSIRLRFQRDETISKLQKAREVLEDRVVERTSDLASKNLQLLKEISEREKTEEALRLERTRFHALAENLPLGLVSISEQGTFQYVNLKFRELFHYELEDISSGRQWFRLAYPDPEYRRQVISSWKKDLGEAKPGELRPREYVVTCKDGSMKHVLFRPVQLITGDHLMTCEDVTERKASEEALRESQERLQTIFDTSPAAIFLVDLEGRITLANQRMADLFARRVDDLQGIHYVELVHPEQRAMGYRKMKALMAGEIDHVSLERRYMTADGREFLGHLSGRRLLRPEGGLHGLVGIIEDITERKWAQEKLRESEERFRMLVETMNEGFGVQDASGRITYVNDRLCELWGYSREQLMGSSVEDFLDEDNRSILRTEMASRKGGTSEHYEVVWTGEGGRRIHSLMSPRPIFDSNGNYAGSFAVITDLTSLKQADERLRDSLTEKEVLLREIHHRVKNNLAVVNSLLRLQSRDAKDEFHRQMFEDAQARIRSLALAHERLCQSENLAYVNMKEYLSSLVDHLISSGRPVGSKVAINKHLENVQLELDLAVPLGFIVNELISNAGKHAFSDRERGSIDITFRQLSGKEFELVVKDDGVGLPEGVDFDRPQSFGVMLVKLFTRQIRGEIELIRDGGTGFRLRFGEGSSSRRE